MNVRKILIRVWLILDRYIRIIYLFFIKKAKWRNGLNKKKKRHEKYIVSLTSYPARFDVLSLTLKSLMYQTVKPDRIIVWLDDFVSKEEYTDEMEEARKYGVEFIEVPYDLKPHKKYFFAMQKYPKDNVITVDDDVVYLPNTISSLVAEHKRNLDAVCARRTHYINYKEGKLLPYNEWKFEYRKREKSDRLFPTGVGGVLYPPSAFSAKAFDLENIKKLCYMADDVWLKFMELEHGIKVVNVKCLMLHPIEIQAGLVSLNNQNVGEAKNDVYIRNMMRFLNMEEECFKENE